MANRLFCFGCGYTARALARLLMTQGWSIDATARNAEQAVSLEAQSVHPVLLATSGLADDALENANAILISTPPGEQGCPAYEALTGSLAKHRETLSWIGYLSTNGVYGDHQGAWIDETASLRPTSERGRERIAAEAVWASFAVEHSLPLVIFRLPGIYGPGRSALDAVRENRARRIDKKEQVFNRMHVDDIAQVLAASIASPQAGDLFNLADDEPAPQHEVVDYACKLLGVEPPPLVTFEEAALSEMAKSFYAENKRIRNDRIKEKLGVTLLYPTYREGLDAIFVADVDKPR